jgi:hypothetical protein
MNNALINTAVAEVVSRATVSAIELANFPLSASDVGCAFTCWEQELRARKGMGVEHKEALIVGVRYTLTQLGFGW